MTYEWNEAVSKEFDEYWGSPYEISVRREISEWIGPTDFLVEIGCGSGRQAEAMKWNFYVGVDGSLPMLALADKLLKGRSAAFMCRDAADTGYGDHSCDTVLCAQVIRHNDDFRPIVKELCRIVKNRLIISDRFLIGETARNYSWEGRWPDIQWNLQEVLAYIMSQLPGWVGRSEVLPFFREITMIEFKRGRDGQDSVVPPEVSG
jgi:ubiquinone/menaquinone biosynthesis C-methylase UbiE